MKHYEYNISLFDYNKDNKTLTGLESNLYYLPLTYSFPNGRKQFFIKNTSSNNFRRFRLVKETLESFIFTSEDDIKCIILKTINLFPAQGKLTD